MDDVTRSLAEQHIREYDMRLQRLDSLLAQAKSSARQTATPADLDAELKRLQHERDMLAAWLDESRGKPIEHWKVDEIQKAGPMGIWDAVAQQLEALVERLER